MDTQRDLTRTVGGIVLGIVLVLLAGVSPALGETTGSDRLVDSDEWVALFDGDIAAPPHPIGEHLVFGAGDTVVAVDPATGDMNWEVPVAGPVVASPTVADEMVYIGDEAGTLWALESGGSVAWNRTLDDPIEGPVATAGPSLVAADAGGTVTGLDRANGTITWTIEADSAIRGGVTVQNNTAVVGTTDGSVYALAANGTVQWNKSLPGGVTGTPAIGGDRIIVGTTAGTVHGLALEDGAEQFTVESGAVLASPVISGERALVPQEDGTVTALGLENGTHQWEHAVPSGPLFGPTVDHDRQAVLVGTDEGVVIAIDLATGTRLWERSLDGDLLTAPVLAEYVITGDEYGRLYGLQPDPVALSVEADETATITLSNDDTVEHDRRLAVYTEQIDPDMHVTTRNLTVPPGESTTTDIEFDDPLENGDTVVALTGHQVESGTVSTDDDDDGGGSGGGTGGGGAGGGGGSDGDDDEPTDEDATNGEDATSDDSTNGGDSTGDDTNGEDSNGDDDSSSDGGGGGGGSGGGGGGSSSGSSSSSSGSSGGSSSTSAGSSGAGSGADSSSGSGITGADSRSTIFQNITPEDATVSINQDTGPEEMPLSGFTPLAVIVALLASTWVIARD